MAKASHHQGLNVNYDYGWGGERKAFLDHPHSRVKLDDLLIKWEMPRELSSLFVGSTVDETDRRIDTAVNWLEHVVDTFGDRDVVVKEVVQKIIQINHPYICLGKSQRLIIHNFGPVLREWVEYWGTTYADLGRVIGVSRKTPSNWVCEDLPMALEYATKMTEEYGCTVEELLAGPPSKGRRGNGESEKSV